MHLDTITNLIDWHETQCHWSSDPILHDKVNGVDNLIHLCQAIGPSSQVPITSYDQPPFHPNDSSYQFDTNLFSGLSAQNDIVQLLKSSCPDCKMFLQIEGSRKTDDLIHFKLCCNHYPIIHSRSDDYFDDNKFTKHNVVRQRLKQSSSKGNSAWERMKNYKLKNNKTFKRAIDRRQNGKDPKGKSNNKRTVSVRSETNARRCHMNIQFYYHIFNESWHLNSKSNLTHSFHVRQPHDATSMNKSDLNEAQLKTLSVLYERGVAPSIIAEAMTSSVKESGGKSGEFLPSTIKNIGNQERRAMEIIKNIDSNWNIAKRTIELLNE